MGHQDNCSICLESLEDSQNETASTVKKCIQTECNHVFHAECLSAWVKNKMICPIDRNYLNRDLTLKLISEAI